jgi:flagellar protein FliO/FliZ
MPGLEKLFGVCLLFAISYIVFKKIIKKEGVQRSDIKIISTMPVGQKEKLIVCEIQNKKFIMGVTQHNISHLHTFESGNIELTNPDDSTKNHYNPYFT